MTMMKLLCPSLCIAICINLTTALIPVTATHCKLDSDCQGDGGTGSVCCNGHCQKDCVRGLCPRPRGRGSCVILCRSDASCPGESKCCYNGCGFVCMLPNYVSLECPCKSRSRGLVTSCKVSCHSDADCGAGNKCCSVGCARRCVKPMQVLVQYSPIPETTTPTTTATTTATELSTKTTATSTATTTTTPTTEPSSTPASKKKAQMI